MWSTDEDVRCRVAWIEGFSGRFGRRAWERGVGGRWAEKLGFTCVFYARE